MSLLKVSHLKIWFLTRDGLVKAVNTVDLEIANEETSGLIGDTTRKNVQTQSSLF